MGTILGAGTGAVIGGLVGALTHVGVPAEDAAHYNEGVRRGGTLLAVKAPDDMAYKVADILGADGAVDIDERAAQYKTQGFVAPAAVAPMKPAVAPVPPVAATANTVANAGNTTVIPIVEEELKVGKRTVEGGGVRVYTHMMETPVTEQVTLHEEHVTVNRTPVNRAATGADLDSALKDRSLEVTETAEEAVVSKTARVVEEVTIGKQATDRVETVSDTVRRTEVDVEDIPGQTTTKRI